MDKKTEIIKKRYNRASKYYDFIEAPMEKLALRSWRLEVMKLLSTIITAVLPSKSLFITLIAKKPIMLMNNITAIKIKSFFLII